MLRVELDTCVLFDTLVNTRRPKYQEYFFKLYQLHLNEFLQIVIPKTVQAEFYGILRAGRTEVLIDGIYVPALFSHLEIMNFIKFYEPLFDMDFLYSIADIYEWKPGTGGDGIPYYKHDFYKIVRDHMGWSDWGLETIVTHTRKIKTKQNGNIDDKYDYPHMAAALVDDVHLLITDNLKNFARPLGPCLVVGMKEHLLTGKLEIDDEYFDQIDVDDDNPYYDDDFEEFICSLSITEEED